jgi:hypothetical protein
MSDEDILYTMYSVWIVEWKEDDEVHERWFTHYHIAKDFARGKPGAVIIEKDVS